MIFAIRSTFIFRETLELHTRVRVNFRLQDIHLFDLPLNILLKHYLFDLLFDAYYTISLQSQIPFLVPHHTDAADLANVDAQFPSLKFPRADYVSPL